MLKSKRSIKMLVCLSLACAMLVSVFGFNAKTASAQEIEKIQPVNTVDCATKQALRNVGNGNVMTELPTNYAMLLAFGANNLESFQIWELPCATDGYSKIYGSYTDNYLTSPIVPEIDAYVRVRNEFTDPFGRAETQLWKLINYGTYYKIQAKVLEGTPYYLSVDAFGFVCQSNINNHFSRWTLEWHPQSNVSQS